MRNPPELMQAEWAAADEEARKLFAKHRISIGRHRPVLFIERQGDRVIGAVAGGIGQDAISKYFGFDVVVDTAHHGKGLGKTLLKAADDYYESIKHNLPDGPRAKVLVINPIVEHILLKLGYHFTYQHRLESTMEKY